MIRKTFFTALLCAIVATTLLGCGGSNKLQTIKISIGDSNTMYNLKGIGGTLQLKVTGNYSSGKTHDLTNVATYSIIPDPVMSPNLPTPPLTVTLSNTGLLTAVQPGICTWRNAQPDPNKVVTDPIWVIDGDYLVTASFDGVTSEQVFVTVASAADPATGTCGP
ncbi:MAG: hypothetical protein HY233_13105 [Acidobacteriales bacterium]|nr:hypothetical protein [Terriglobales bacterium]